MIATTRTGNTLEAANPGSRGGSVRHVQHALATEEAEQDRPSIHRQRRNVAMEVGNAHGDEDDIHAAVDQAPDFRREVLVYVGDGDGGAQRSGFGRELSSLCLEEIYNRKAVATAGKSA